jgi:hypothetical protein
MIIITMKKYIQSPKHINFTKSVGLTEITFIPDFRGFNSKSFYKGHEKYFGKKWAIMIGHNGNMGHTVEHSVDPNLRVAFGCNKISISQIKKHCIEYKELGSPSYSYGFYGILNVKKLNDLEK